MFNSADGPAHPAIVAVAAAAAAAAACVVVPAVAGEWRPRQ